MIVILFLIETLQFRSLMISFILKRRKKCVLHEGTRESERSIKKERKKFCMSVCVCV